MLAHMHLLLLLLSLPMPLPLRCRCRFAKTCATIAHLCRSVATPKPRHRSPSRDRSRSRSREGTYHVTSVQEVALHDDLSQTAVDPKEEVLWLVDQSDMWPGFWRVSEKIASAMETQFRNGDESADGQLTFDNGVVHYYRQTMINGAAMRHIRFADEARSEVMFDRRLARVTMQKVRWDKHVRSDR